MRVRRLTHGARSYIGNVVDLWERLAADMEPEKQSGRGGQRRRPVVVPHLGSDQTSCHIPFSGGYFPVGLSYEESKALMADDPPAFKAAVQARYVCCCCCWLSWRGATLRGCACAHACMQGAAGMFFGFASSQILLASRKAHTCDRATSSPPLPPLPLPPRSHHHHCRRPSAGMWRR